MSTTTNATATNPKDTGYWLLRASAFNLCFYSMATFFCIILLPILFVPRKFMPRKILMSAIYLFLHANSFLEKHVLGLTYEIRGTENLPQDPPYIIAAKHQSTYETLKLHFLFKDPAPVLKKELLKIPLWGKYLEKSDVIAIDRSSPKTAIKSIREGALRVTEQKRPIVIFPQGTRVPPGIGTDKKPYKMGVTRIQSITNLPIIPMATNAGVYYPKGKWCKKPGCVVFEFLPAIEASEERSATQTLKQIETIVEEKSNTLINEAYKELHEKKTNKSFPRILTITILALFAAYSAYWFYSAHMIKTSYSNWIAEIQQNDTVTEINSSPLRIHGYPWKLCAALSSFSIQTQKGMFEIKDIHAATWPFPNKPITFHTKNIKIALVYIKTAIEFDSLTTLFKLQKNTVIIEEALLKHKESSAALSGEVKTPLTPSKSPQVNLDIVIKNHGPFLMNLVQNGIVDQKSAMMASIVLQAFVKEDKLHTNLTTQRNKLFLGPVNIHTFPTAP